MVGAAVATMAAYLLLYVFHLIMARVVINEPYHYPYRFFYAYLLLAVAVTALFYIIVDLTVLRWAIAAVTGALLLWRIVKNKSIF